MPGRNGAGFALTSSSLHIWAPPHFMEHLGFSHFAGLHFHVHCGSAHLLSHCVSEQLVVHFGGLQTVIHLGQSPCSQCIEGHTMAHFGGSHFCVHVARLIGGQAVSHLGGAQTGSQTSSQSALPHDHQHLGWHPRPSEDAAAPGCNGVGWPLLLKNCGGRGPPLNIGEGCLSLSRDLVLEVSA